MVSQNRNAHRDCDTLFEAVSKENQKLFVPGDRSLKEFSNAYNAPGSSPVSVQDTYFATLDRCKLG